MLQMERDIELNEGQKLHLVHKLQEQATELAQLDVESLVYESNQKRMSRAKQRVEYLRRFADIVTETMALAEIFWVLMQLDLQRMKNRNNYDPKLDAYRMKSLGSNRRIVSSFFSSFFFNSLILLGRVVAIDLIHFFSNFLFFMLILTFFFIFVLSLNLGRSSWICWANWVMSHWFSVTAIMSWKFCTLTWKDMRFLSPKKPSNAF